MTGCTCLSTNPKSKKDKDLERRPSVVQFPHLPADVVVEKGPKVIETVESIESLYDPRENTGVNVDMTLQKFND